MDSQPANFLIAGALLIATPFFVVFGGLSDRIGRKKIILAGCVLAALTYFPLFRAITHYANPAIETASQRAPVVVLADPGACSFQFDPVGKKQFVSSCDLAKAALAKAGVPYHTETLAPGSMARVRVGEVEVPSFEGAALAKGDFKQASEGFSKTLAARLKDAGYPAKADPAHVNYPMLLLLLTILVIYVTMVYGPIASWLFELFPARIRYTSLSLPYHIGNGWFGGFLPTVAFALVALTGDIYSGLWYPVIIALVTAIVGALFLPETKGQPLR
jgi:MFS family permease